MCQVSGPRKVWWAGISVLEFLLIDPFLYILKKKQLIGLNGLRPTRQFNCRPFDSIRHLLDRGHPLWAILLLQVQETTGHRIQDDHLYAHWGLVLYFGYSHHFDMVPSINRPRYFFVPAADTVDCPNVCLLMGFVKVFGGLISFIWTFNISYILKTCLFDPSFSL
jgi:hypothetical protein